MFLKILRAEFIKQVRSWFAYILLFGGSALIGYAISKDIGGRETMDQFLLIMSLMYLYPVGIALVSDILARADAKNWPLLYTKDIRFQYVLAKSVHLTFLSSIALAISAAIFLYPLEARIVGGGFSAEAMESAIWFLFFLWLAYFPTFFLFSYVSSISSPFMVSVLALILFIVYPVGRSAIGYYGGSEAQQYKDAVTVWDTISPTSLPWTFHERIKEDGWMADKCRVPRTVTETHYSERTGESFEIKIEECGYRESLEKIFGFEPKKFFEDVRTNGGGTEVFFIWMASLAVIMILSYFHLREREAP